MVNHQAPRLMGSVAGIPVADHEHPVASPDEKHRLAKRMSAFALVPLTLWFAASIIAHSSSDYTGSSPS
jgi:hypothetical protein